MNRIIGAIGSIVNAVTVLLFAIFLLVGWKTGYFFVCIILSMSFVCMMGGFYAECKADKKAAGIIAVMFSAVYAVLIMIVYYTQCTTVVNEELSYDVAKVLDYKYMGLIFNLDIFGYGIMALATFFMGLTIDVKNKKDKALTILLLLHGGFFPGCLIMPMTGMFTGSTGSSSSGGVMALEIWCLYFLPIGILSYIHFMEKCKNEQVSL